MYAHIIPCDEEGFRLQTRNANGFRQLFRNFDLQLAHPMKPWESLSWSVWVDENMELKATEAI